MLAFDGNTAPYLQYAHARICSIFRRAEVDRADVRGERDHARGTTRNGRWPSGCSAIRRRSPRRWRPYSPHKLAIYLFDLAQDFTAFYEHCPVMRAEEPLRASRLALCDLTARTLQHGLGLLGIEAPESM